MLNCTLDVTINTEVLYHGRENTLLSLAMIYKNNGVFFTLGCCFINITQTQPTTVSFSLNKRYLYCWWTQPDTARQSFFPQILPPTAVLTLRGFLLCFHLCYSGKGGGGGALSVDLKALWGELLILGGYIKIPPTAWSGVFSLHSGALLQPWNKTMWVFFSLFSFFF